MAYNKDGKATGISNGRASELGYPASSEMSQVPEQRRQMPFEHKSAPAGSFDDSYLQPIQPITDLKTQGAQFQVVPQRLDPGVASFLRSDAVMKQQGAQQADVFNRLDLLEKQGGSRDKMQQLEGLGDARLTALVNLAQRHGPFDQEPGSIPEPPQFSTQDIPSPQEQAMQYQEPPPPPPDVGGAEAPEEEEDDGLDEGEFWTGSPDNPKQTPEDKAEWEKKTEAGYTMKKGADGKGVWVGPDGEINQWGDPLPGEEENSGLSRAKDIISQELKRYEEGGEVEEALLYEAKSTITNQKRELDMMLMAQGGPANVANNPALAEMAWQEAKGLISAKAAIERLQSTMRLSAAQALGNIDLAERSLQQKNMALIVDTMVQLGWEPSDKESLLAMLGYLDDGDMDALTSTFSKEDEDEDEGGGPYAFLEQLFK